MSSRLLTVPEVAERLHLSKWTIYTLVEEGRLKAIRLRPKGTLRFAEEAVEEVMKKAAVPTGTAG